MAQPILGQTHIDVPLTNISTAYIQNQDNFVASKIFPVVPVEKLSNKYYTFGKNAWFRDEAQMRADATESAGGGFDLSTDNYSCDVWAFHKDIGDNIRYNSDSQIDIDRASTEFVTQRLLLKAESSSSARSSLPQSGEPTLLAVQTLPSGATFPQRLRTKTLKLARKLFSRIPGSNRTLWFLATRCTAS